MAPEASANAKPNQSHDSKKRQEYQIHLLALYTQYVKETGRIDYPDLREFILQACEVEAGPEGTVLLPEDISILAENVRIAQANIVTVAQELYSELVELAEAIARPDNCRESEYALGKSIHKKTQTFIHAVEYLLDISHHYIYLPLLSSPEGDGEFETARDREWVRKQMNDLKYIREYIIEHAQVGIIKTEFTVVKDTKIYFRRLYKYVEILPGLTDILGDLVCQAIEHKLAGGTKFAPPKFYNNSGEKKDDRKL